MSRYARLVAAVTTINAKARCTRLRTAVAAVDGVNTRKVRMDALVVSEAAYDAAVAKVIDLGDDSIITPCEAEEMLNEIVKALGFSEIQTEG